MSKEVELSKEEAEVYQMIGRLFAFCVNGDFRTGILFDDSLFAGLEVILSEGISDESSPSELSDALT